MTFLALFCSLEQTKLLDAEFKYLVIISILVKSTLLNENDNNSLPNCSFPTWAPLNPYTENKPVKSLNTCSFPTWAPVNPYTENKPVKSLDTAVSPLGPP